MNDQDIISEEERREAATEEPIGCPSLIPQLPGGADGAEPIEETAKANELPKLISRIAKTPSTVVFQFTLPSGRTISAELENEDDGHGAQAFIYDDKNCVCQIRFFGQYQNRNWAYPIVRRAINGALSKAGKQCRHRQNKQEEC